MKFVYFLFLIQLISFNAHSINSNHQVRKDSSRTIYIYRPNFTFNIKFNHSSDSNNLNINSITFGLLDIDFPNDLIEEMEQKKLNKVKVYFAIKFDSLGVVSSVQPTRKIELITLNKFFNEICHEVLLELKKYDFSLIFNNAFNGSYLESKMIFHLY